MAKTTAKELEQQITRLTASFARELVALVSNVGTEELGTVARSMARFGAASAGLALPVKRRAWPNCSVAGCGARYYPASGRRYLCYSHFLEKGGKHPSRRK